MVFFKSWKLVIEPEVRFVVDADAGAHDLEEKIVRREIDCFWCEIGLVTFFMIDEITVVLWSFKVTYAFFFFWKWIRYSKLDKGFDVK